MKNVYISLLVLSRGSLDSVTPLLYLLVLLAPLLELLVVILAEIGPLPLYVQARRLSLGEGDRSDGVIFAASN